MYRLDKEEYFSSPPTFSSPRQHFSRFPNKKKKIGQKKYGKKKFYKKNIFLTANIFCNTADFLCNTADFLCNPANIFPNPANISFALPDNISFAPPTFYVTSLFPNFLFLDKKKLSYRKSRRALQKLLAVLHKMLAGRRKCWRSEENVGGANIK